MTSFLLKMNEKTTKRKMFVGKKKKMRLSLKVIRKEILAFLMIMMFTLFLLLGWLSRWSSSPALRQNQGHQVMDFWQRRVSSVAISISVNTFLLNSSGMSGRSISRSRNSFGTRHFLLPSR